MQRRTIIIVVVICSVLVLAASTLLLRRTAAASSGRVTTTAVSFVADPSTLNKGIFVSDARVHMILRNFERIESVDPDPPLRFTATDRAATLEFENVSLDSVDMTGPVRLDLSAVDHQLAMHLSRESGRDVPLAVIKLYSNSRFVCSGCRDHTSSKLARDAVSLQIQRGKKDVFLIIKTVVPDDGGIPIHPGSSMTFAGPHESALLGGSLSFDQGPEFKINKRDLLYLKGFRRAALDRVSFDRSESRIEVAWTGEIEQTVLQRLPYSGRNVNPTWASKIIADPLFRSLAPYGAGLMSVLAFLQLVKQLFKIQTKETG